MTWRPPVHGALAAVFILSVLPAANLWARTTGPEGMPIRELRLQGLENTREYVVTRELESAAGAPFRRDVADEERQRLLDLGIFSSVEIEGVVENDSVTVVYGFVENFRFMPGISMSITDENGLSVGLSASSPNMWGKDITGAAKVQVGGASTIMVSLENPWVSGNHLGYRFEYAFRKRDNQVANFRETANEFYLRVRTYLGDNARLGGSLESIHIGSDRAGVTLSPDNVDHVSRIGAYLQWDTRDARTDTRAGWWNELALSRDVQLFENATGFTQIDVDIRRYQPFPFWSRHNLALFSLLTLRTGAIGSEIAPWQVFGIGGTNTVRGWEYAARRGKNQLIGTLEYRLTPLLPRRIDLPFGLKYRAGLQLALFGDVGVAWDEGPEFAIRNTIGGYGLGARLLLPSVGMVRFDLGLGQAGFTARLHIGSLEKAEAARKRVR